MVHDVGHPIAFHMDAYPQPKKFVAGSREGIWWLPNTAVTDYLILTNTGDQPLSTNSSVYDSTGTPFRQNVTLSPRQTQRLSVRSLLRRGGLNGTYGGIEVKATDRAGYLDTAHVIFDEVAGFGAIMKMFQHNPESKLEERTWGGVKQWTTRAPMLALTNPDPALAFPSGTQLQPMVFLRNDSTKSYTADIRFNWYSDASSGSTAASLIPLRPHETHLVDVQALQNQALIPLNAKWASVIVSAPVQPDDIMAVAASYDKTLRYGTQAPFNDQLASQWAGGKWEVDATHDSIVTAGNGGNKPIRAEVTLFYNGGQSRYKLEQTIAPDGQLWLDLGKLIHNQVPDKDGNILPVNLTSGTYQFRDLTDAAVGNIFEGKVITDKTYGHAAYGCMICCGYPYGTAMWTDPLGLILSMIQPQDVASVNACYGTTDPIGFYYSSWWTGNTSIAISSSTERFEGMSAGTTGDFASGNINVGDGMTYVQTCPMQGDQASGGTAVIDFGVAGKTFIFVGTDPNTVAANVFVAQNSALTGGPNPSGGTFTGTSSDSKDTFKSSTLAGLASLTITTPDQSTTSNDRTLTFTYAPTTGSVQKTLSVTARQYAYLTNDNPGDVCNLPYGTDQTYTYTVYTHPDKTAVDGNSGVTGTAVTESFNPALTCHTVTGDGALNSNGQFRDHVASACSSSPLTCSQTSTQTFNVGGITTAVRTNKLTWGPDGVTYQSNGPTQ